jgi:hypothetical protein
VVSVLSVFFVLLLLTFLAVAINLGRLLRTRGDLQNAADAAALAAVGALDSGPTGPDFLARRILADFSDASTTSIQGKAVAIAQAHNMAAGVGQVAAIDPGTDVEFGFWHLRGPELCAFGAGTMCGPGWEPPSADLKTNPVAMLTVNAARVTARYSLPSYFYNFLGVAPSVNMTARATAYGRQTRTRCALPTAVSVCQLIGPGGFGLDCSAGPINLTFVNAQDGVDSTHPQAFGRIDLINQWDPASDFGTMREYIRLRDFWHCERDDLDTPPTTEYLPVVGQMPDVPRGNIQPVVDALAGIPTDGAGHQPGRCLLGQKLLVPVIKPIGIETAADCANICPAGPDPGGCTQWPATNQQRVVGFVNITFTALHCWHEASPHPKPGAVFVQPTLTAANCETEMDNDPTNPGLLASHCGGTNGMDPTWQAGLRVDAQITCDAPVGPLGTTGTAILPRLVR